jgi:Zn-dependent protease with chaperone function
VASQNRLKHGLKHGLAELLIAASAASGVGCSSVVTTTSVAEPVGFMNSRELAEEIKSKLADDTYRELTPKMILNYQELAEGVLKQSYQGTPRFFQDTENEKRTAEVRVLGKLENRPIVIINAAALKVTEEYAERYAVFFPEEMRDWVPAEKAGMQHSVLSAHAKLSAKQGLPAAPEVFVDVSDESPVPRAGVAFTYERKPAIVVNRAKVQQEPRQVLGSLAHENEHVVNKDVEPSRMAAAMNDASLSQALELAADEGAKHLCRPSDFADSLKTTMLAMAKRSATLNGKVTTEDAFKRISEADDMSTHPSFEERIKRIRQLPENAPGCITLAGDKNKLSQGR